MPKSKKISALAARRKAANRKKPAKQDLAKPSPESPLALAKVVTRRIQDYGQITSAAAAPTFGGINFQLANVQGNSELTVLYDQYRIEEVCLIFKPINKYLQVSGAAVNNPTFMVHSIDVDDSTAPTTLTEMWEKSLTDIHYYYDSWKVQFQPKPAVATYNSGAFTGYAQLSQSNLWIDCANASVEHYGFKFVIPSASSTTLTGWRLYIIYKLAFRYMR